MFAGRTRIRTNFKRKGIFINNENLIVCKTIDLIIKLCNFNEEYNHFDKYTESEALKCIVNLLVKFKSAIEILNRLNVPEKITKKIKVSE